MGVIWEGIELDEAHTIADKPSPGLPIMGRVKGAFCKLCGDYVRHVDRASEEKTMYKGCETCKPTHRKRIQDAAIVGSLEFK